MGKIGMKNLFLIIMALVCLQGCSQGDSHIPSVFELPVVFAGSAIENGIYNARRNKVKSYIVQHYDDLKIETQKGEGENLNGLLRIVGVDKNKYFEARQQLQKDHSVMFKNIMLMTESIMQNYSFIYIFQSSEKTKTINGLSYTEASHIIQRYLNKNFEEFRVAIKAKNTNYLRELARELKIKKPENQRIFLDYILTKYDEYFIEPAVVGAMVLR